MALPGAAFDGGRVVPVVVVNDDSDAATPGDESRDAERDDEVPDASDASLVHARDGGAARAPCSVLCHEMLGRDVELVSCRTTDDETPGTFSVACEGIVRGCSRGAATPHSGR